MESRVGMDIYNIICEEIFVEEILIEEYDTGCLIFQRELNESINKFMMKESNWSIVVGDRDAGKYKVIDGKELAYFYSLSNEPKIPVRVIKCCGEESTEDIYNRLIIERSQLSIVEIAYGCKRLKNSIGNRAGERRDLLD